MPSEIQTESTVLFPVTRSRSSSFSYQIVVRETENRQLLHILSLRGICGSRMRPFLAADDVDEILMVLHEISPCVILNIVAVREEDGNAVERPPAT